MAWAIEYFKEAQKDLAKIDYSQKLQVLKAIEKVSQNPTIAKFFKENF